MHTNNITMVEKKSLQEALTLYHKILTFKDPEKESFGK